jgi:hypothetical protein
MKNASILDDDGQGEMLLICSFGSGVHQTRVGLYAPGIHERRMYEADVTYLGNLRLIAGERSLVPPRWVDVNPDAWG